MRYLILLALLAGNPWAGVHGDWAPLKHEYDQCRYSSHTYFSYYVCTDGAYNRAVAGTISV
ncbi:MAG: hypothetical protein ACXVYB_00280 [Arthrobacter sp.]